jgi:hypothetical protein
MTIIESVNNIYSDIKKSVNKRSFDSGDILSILVNTMQLAEKYKDNGEKLSGRDKKHIVLKVIAKVISDLPIEEDIKDKVKFFVEFIAPMVIDMIIAASKSQFALNTKKKFREKCGACFK